MRRGDPELCFDQLLILRLYCLGIYTCGGIWSLFWAVMNVHDLDGCDVEDID